MSDLPARRRWLTVSLRTLVVLIAAMALSLGWYVRRVGIQRDAVAAIMKSGGRVSYGWELVESPGPFGVPILEPLRNGKPPAPGWMTSFLSSDYFSGVRAAGVGRRDTDRVMASVARLQRLEQLTVGSADPVSDAGMIHLGGLPWLRSLMLQGRSPRLTARGLANLKKNSRLQRLDLFRFPLTDDELAPIGDLLSLKELTLDGPAVTSAGLQHLRRLTNLRHLSLRRSGVDDLSPLKDLNQLQQLSVVAARVDSRGLAHLAGHPSLESLNLSGCRTFTDEALPVLSSLPKLSSLHLVQTSITEAGLPLLAELRGLRKLRLEVDGPGLRHLSALADLEELYLMTTLLDAADAVFLAKLKKLEILVLTDTKIDDETLAHLAGHPSLKRLLIGGTQVTNAGLAHLRGLPNLEHLDLHRTKVTDAGLVHLSALKRLNRLHLAGTEVTAAGLAALQSANPRLRVTGSPDEPIGPRASVK